jgi:hypothetical protein
MNNIEPLAMREIHAIQEMMYESTRHLTSEEKAHVMNETGRALVAAYGLTIVQPSALDVSYSK